VQESTASPSPDVSVEIEFTKPELTETSPEATESSSVIGTTPVQPLVKVDTEPEKMANDEKMKAEEENIKAASADYSWVKDDNT